MKILGIIQARMGSSRLPGKVMKEVPTLTTPPYDYFSKRKKVSILGDIIDRVKRCRLLDTITVATTMNPEDEEIHILCNHIMWRDSDNCSYMTLNRPPSVSCFRGATEDVLDRLYCCAVNMKADVIVRFSGDNPLVDSAVADLVIAKYLANRYDYVSNCHPVTYPDGLEVEVFGVKTLERAWKEAKKDFEREHGTPYIWMNPDKFDLGVVLHTEDLYTENRWTIDYVEDYDFINTVYDHFNASYFSMRDVLKLLEEKPEIREINKMHLGDNWASKMGIEL